MKKLLFLFIFPIIIICCQNKNKLVEDSTKLSEKTSQRKQTNLSAKTNFEKTNPKKLDKKSDKYQHRNLPESYDIGSKSYVYKFFRVNKDKYYNFTSLEFWNDDSESYTTKVNLSDLNPYKNITQLQIAEESKFQKNPSFIYYNIIDFPQKEKYISSEYPPDYASDFDITKGRIEIHVEELFSEPEKEVISVSYMLNVTNDATQVLGVESTVFLFDKEGNILKTLKFDTPTNYFSTNSDGRYFGFVLGGLYGDLFQIIYPFTFRLYNTKEEKFELKDDSFLGESLGGGSKNDIFFYSFEDDNIIREVIIDINKRIVRKAEIPKEKLENLKYMKDGYYYKSNNKPAYLFEKDFVNKKF